MKRLIALVLTLALVLCVGASLVSCNQNDEKTITVAASPTPHAEILAIAKDILAQQGYTLVIREFDDYVLPNSVVFNGECDANYFQHVPYLNTFNADNNMDLISVAAIHYEPLGLYGNGVTLADIKDGDKIFIPADDSNETRALLLLAQEGLITIPEGKDINTGINHLDITAEHNPHGYEITAVEASTTPAQLKNNSGTYAVINGNYAIGAGLKIADALATEAVDGQAATTYANILAVKPENKNAPKILALIEALQSKAVADFIAAEYAGAVVSMTK